MGAQRMTLSDFYADAGFGQVAAREPVSYPEFPTHNSKLQALYRSLAPDSPQIAPILGQLDLARAYQAQGLHLQAAEALAGADTLLDLATRSAGSGNKTALVLLLLLGAVLLVVAMRRSGALEGRRRRNLPPPRPRPRRRRSRKDDDDDEPEEEPELDDEPEDEPDDEPEDEPEDDDDEDAGA